MASEKHPKMPDQARIFGEVAVWPCRRVMVVTDKHSMMRHSATEAL